MPRYLYKCAHCKEMVTVRHGMGENIEKCDSCGEQDCMKRVPSFPIRLNKASKEKKVGQVVKNHIEEAKKDIKKDKKEMKGDYKP